VRRAELRRHDDSRTRVPRTDKTQRTENQHAHPPALRQALGREARGIRLATHLAPRFAEAMVKEWFFRLQCG